MSELSTSPALKSILKTIADITEAPKGAYNIRLNGQGIERHSTENIEIVPKPNGTGIEIYVKPGTKGEDVHIPVVVSKSDFKDLVYNDFYIGNDCDVNIVAGCGIHNDGEHLSQHDGIHTFHIGKNTKVRYVENHYGEGNGSGQRVLNPITVVHLEKAAILKWKRCKLRALIPQKELQKRI